MPVPVAHPSPFSGTWYPGAREDLAGLLDRLWRESEKRTGPSTQAGGLAFVVPHAGLEYSGTVASAVYRQLERTQPRCVIVAGFAHRGSPAGVFIPDVGSYSTPLGRVEVDLATVDVLAQAEPFGRCPEERLCDHSVEIQLPLLQRAAPNARVVPLYVGHLDPAARAKAAGRLAGLVTPETVLLASSDLTHFGSSFGFKPFPVDGEVKDRLHQLDFEVMEAAGTLRPEYFLETIRRTSSTVCGCEPIALLLETVRQLGRRSEVFQRTLDYQTSGEISGDFHNSVSYGALGYFPYEALKLDAEAQRAILSLARGTLAEYQRTGKRCVPRLPHSGLEALQRRAALFVTLHQRGQLRGCLGRTSAIQSLEQAVPELTMAAALEDSRFPPVLPSEADLEIEVSILSPEKLVVNRDDFRVGVHGGLLDARGRQGLLLPQVATERNWNAKQFFDALAAKTGVSQDVYQDPATRLYAFRAQVLR